MSYDPFKQPWTIQDDKIFSGGHVIAEVSGPRWREVAAVMAAALEMREALINVSEAYFEKCGLSSTILSARVAIAKGGVQ